MLILSRKANQSIIIDKDIKITFLGLGRGSAGKIGIEAPRKISIHREEIQERINREELDAIKNADI